VALQYRLEGGVLWHSLGNYSPGHHAELGGGVLLLPATASIRAVETQTADSDQPRVIADWGNIGEGLPTVYVDTTMCNRQSTVNVSPGASPAPPPSPQKGPSQWILWAAAIFAVIALIVALWNSRVKK